MKRSILLLLAGAIAGSVNGQQATKSIVFGQSVDPTIQEAGLPYLHSVKKADAHRGTAAAAARGTVGGTRWYDYSDEIFGTNAAVQYAQSALGLWNDTTSIWGYSGTTPYAGNSFTSIGLSFDGFASAWNDATNFPGVIALDPTKNYSIDSVKVAAIYARNYATTAKTNVVDTLILTLVKGDGTASADLALGLGYGGSLATHYGVTSVDFLAMYHDSLNNRAGKSTGPIDVPWPMPTALPSTQVYKFALTGADSMTTGTYGTSGTLNISYPRPGHVPADPIINFAVPAGSYAAVSVTFKSGDGTYPAYPGRDTIRYSGTSGAQKYNSYIPLLGYTETATGSGVANWAPYISGDWAVGYFKREGPGASGGLYTPHWGWTTSSGTAASALQYPMVSFHVDCPTCVLTGTPGLNVAGVTTDNSVKVYPNPATNELNITTANNVKATVSLINTVGQTVATQISNGKATFNTSAMAAGVYMYVVEANGTRTTGRVSVAH